MLANRLGNQTFGLHEIAVRAAILGNLVHDETIERLGASFKAPDIAADSAKLAEEQAEGLIGTCMIHYVMGARESSESPIQLRKQCSKCTVCVLLLFSLPGQISARAFLRKDVSALVTDTHLQLLEELEGAVGEAHRQATGYVCAGQTMTARV